MNDIHLKLLRINHCFLVNNLKLNIDFLDILFKTNVLNSDTKEEILNQLTTCDQNRKFLEVLKRRGPIAFSIFLNALENSDQELIKNKLMNHTCTESSAQIFINLQPDELSKKPTFSELTYEHYEMLSNESLMEFEPLNNNIQFSKNACYPVTCINGCIGYAVIINVMIYEDNNATRYGSEYDCGYLEDLFTKLKIDTKIYTSIKNYEDLTSYIQSEADFIRNQCHKYSFFIFCLMAHGVNRHICTPDGNKIKLQLIYDYFLHGTDYFLEMPKIFIVQACQTGSMYKTLPSNDKEVDKNITVTSTNVISHTSDDSLSSNLEIYAPDFSPENYCEFIPDFIDQSSSSLDVKHAFNRAFLFATVPGFNAYLSKNSGSIFIKTLVFVLSRYYNYEDLTSMMNAVTRILNGLKDDEGRTVQCPFFLGTLKKKMYLRTTNNLS